MDLKKCFWSRSQMTYCGKGKSGGQWGVGEVVGREHYNTSVYADLPYFIVPLLKLLDSGG